MKKWAYNELGVPEPKDNEEVLEITEESSGIATPAKADFSAPDDEFTGFDSAVDSQLKTILPVRQKCQRPAGVKAANQNKPCQALPQAVWPK